MGVPKESAARHREKKDRKAFSEIWKIVSSNVMSESLSLISSSAVKMASGSDIDVSPSELRFRFQIGKSIPSHVVLHNTTKERHAFKIKTTSPKKYCVRPASGYIEAMGTKQIEVIMQSQKEYPTEGHVVRDKFLLLTTPVSTTDLEVVPELFDKVSNPQVKESRLRVVLDVPMPPQTIPEHEEGEEAGVGEENELQALRQERDELRVQVEKLKRRFSQKEAEGFSYFHVLLVTILAFIIGHYFAPQNLMVENN